jgi:hypothetical protein
MGKRKKLKFNNPYKIDNETADDIRALKDDELIDRVAKEYVSWMHTEKERREDPEIVAIRERLKDLSEDIKSDEKYKKAKEEFDAVVESLIDDSQASYKEEMKNLVEPYAEDLKLFKGCFKIAMDEVNRRRLQKK